MQTEITNPSTKQPNTKPNKGRKKWLIGGAIILLAGILIATNFSTIKVYYAYLFKATHFNMGDKVYIRKFKAPNGTYFTGTTLMRMIKPMNEREIDTLEISDREKAILKAKIDPSAPSYLFMTHQVVEMKNRSGLLGIYEGQEKSKLKYNSQFLPGFFYKISNCDIKMPSIDLPEGYTFANNDYYIGPFNLSTDQQDIPIQ